MSEFSNANNVFTQTNTTLVLTAVLKNFYNTLKKREEITSPVKSVFILLRHYD